MLNENIKTIRKSKGISQEELANRLNVVRQTVSKWENGLSVPDADMLIGISDALDTPVSILLGENVTEEKTQDLKVIAEKLETINLQFARRKEIYRKICRSIFVATSILIISIFVILTLMNSSYLNWDYSNPQTAFEGVALQTFEWMFIRIAPVILLITIFGIFVFRKKKQ